MATWFGKQQTDLASGVKNLSIKLRDVTFFLYPGREDLIVGTFTEDALVGQEQESPFASVNIGQKKALNGKLFPKPICNVIAAQACSAAADAMGTGTSFWKRDGLMRGKYSKLEINRPCLFQARLST